MDIEVMHKKADKLISEMKSSRHMIDYKQQEYSALSKFLEIEANKPNQREIMQLKKQKNRLEFKLSTEPRISLSMEREMVRKINEISSELNTKLRYSSLEKKFDFLKGDIERYTLKIEKLSKEVKEINQQTDEMYSKLKAMLGIKNISRPIIKNTRPQNPEYKKKHQIHEQEISLEDIAIIKRKNIGKDDK